LLSVTKVVSKLKLKLKLCAVYLFLRL